MLSPEGEVYEKPEALAEALVGYMHDCVREIFSYSPAALAALDTHFAQHPPADEYNNEFLWTGLIPALGAYLGQVLVKTFHGQWRPAHPLMKSEVRINDRECNPFAQAFEVVYERQRLMEIYDGFTI